MGHCGGPVSSCFSPPRQYAPAAAGTQFTCFTGTKVQILTQLLQLDLLGHKHAHVTWQFENTRPVFERLQAAERHLRAAGKLKGNDGAQYLSDGGGRARGAIQDDHLPFLKRNVPVVHLIASPFPKFWHTAQDTLDVVDGLVMRDMCIIFCVFVAELYLA